MDKRIIVALALVAACGKNKQQCQADVADLVDYMKSMNIEDTKIGATSAHLVVRTAGTKKPAAWAAIVEVFADRVIVDGFPVDPAAVGDKLVEIKNRRSERGLIKQSEDGNMVLIAVDEAAPFGKVATVLDSAVAAGHDHVGLLYAGSTTTQPPPKTGIEDEVAKAGPGEEATALAKALKDLSAKCKPMQKALSDIASFDSGNKADMFVAGMGEAMLQCDCNTDLAKMRSVAYVLFGKPPLRAIFFVADKGTALELPGATLWKDAGMKVTDQTRYLVAK